MRREANDYNDDEEKKGTAGETKREREKGSPGN